MNSSELKEIAEGLIKTTELAGNKSVDLQEKGLKIIRKPDDTLIARSGTLNSDGTDGKMYYDTASGDLNAAGHYKLQGRVSLSSSTYYTTIYNFQVHAQMKKLRHLIFLNFYN